MFDVVFLRGPSYLESYKADSAEFLAALDHMINRARHRLVYVAYSAEPYGVPNKSLNYMHDPEHIERAFQKYEGATVTYKDGYIVADWIRPRGIRCDD